MKQFFVIMAALVAGPMTVLAAENDGQPKSPQQCEHKLSVRGPLQVIPSGNDFLLMPKIKDAAEKVADIAFKLGMHVPPHQLTFASSSELSLLVAVSGSAVPHWIDGQKIVEGQNTLSGVMEFVTGGCPTCRSFYRDTTPFKEQISILMHVAGHMDVGKESIWRLRRGGDEVAASARLADKMAVWKQRVGSDEVDFYYQLLQSMISMQDMARGSFQSVQDLNDKRQGDYKKRVYVSDSEAEAKWKNVPSYVRNLLEQKKEILEVSGKDESPKIFPSAPTASVLQAYVASLPEHYPQWKKDMAAEVEERYRFYGANVQQKVLNEGWASFSQYLIARHSEWTTSNDVMSFAGLMSHVAVPGISNPYWLGLQGWWTHWKNFQQRPEIQALPNDFEKDKAFVVEAHKIMHNMTDYDFIRYVFDDQWVHKLGLVLKRDLTPQEMQQARLQEPHEVILSRDPKRILNYIARRVAYKPHMFPRIMLADINHRGEEVLYKHDVIENIPLERFSAAQTLFALTRLHARTVSLDTVMSPSWIARAPAQPSYFTWNPQSPHSLGTSSAQQGTSPSAEISPIRITVTPSAKVSVFNIVSNAQGEKSLQNNAELTAQLQEAVDLYELDMQASMSDQMAEEDRAKHQQILTAISGAIVKPAREILHHAPTAASAILEYSRMIEERVLRAARAAIAGKAKFKTVKGGIALRALPMIPEFSFDQRARQKLVQSKKPAPVDYAQAAVLAEIGQDDAVGLGQSPGLPGDIKKKQDGKGKGQGTPKSGDPDDGDDEQEGEPGEPDQPGNIDGSGNDPSVVVIPLELWGKLLMEDLELPNPKKTSGGNEIVDRVRASSVPRDAEPLHVEKTVEEALSWGLAQQKKMQALQGGDVSKKMTAAQRSQKVREAIRLGFKNMPPEEMRAKSWEIVTEPDFKAVVVFVMDLSGSTAGLPQQRAKEFVFNTVAFLKQHYKEVVVRYVGYDSEAHEFTEDQIFKTILNGSTQDSVGYVMTETILEDYKDDWAKYVYGLGDGGSYDGPATVASMNRIYPQVQHMGFVEMQINGGYGVPAFLEPIKGLSQTLPWFSYTKITEDFSSVFQAVKDFFGKNRKK